MHCSIRLHTALPVQHLLYLSPLSTPGLCHHLLCHRRCSAGCAASSPSLAVPVRDQHCRMKAPESWSRYHPAAGRHSPALPAAFGMVPAASRRRTPGHHREGVSSLQLPTLTPSKALEWCIRSRKPLLTVGTNGPLCMLSWWCTSESNLRSDGLCRLVDPFLR